MLSLTKEFEEAQKIDAFRVLIQANLEARDRELETQERTRVEKVKSFIVFFGLYSVFYSSIIGAAVLLIRFIF